MVQRCRGIHDFLLWVEFIPLSRRCDITGADEGLAGRESAASRMKDKRMKKMQMEKSFFFWFFFMSKLIGR